MVDGAVRELHYRVGTPARGHFPGHHRSTRGDGGFEFRGHAPLVDAPDPRRLDLHASLRDPFERWVVRVNSQRLAIPVAVVADVSASMGFVGARRRLDVVADFVESLAASAWRTGDSFGFVGCDDALRGDLALLPTRQRGAGHALAARLRRFDPTGRSSAALADAHRVLGRRRALVFLVSDFHLPLATVDAALDSLAHHEVVPVVVWDAHEFALPVANGLAHVVDPESGVRRVVWWRPALRVRWQAVQQGRRDVLMERFRRRALKPLVVEGAFDADAVTRHFHG